MTPNISNLKALLTRTEGLSETVNGFSMLLYAHKQMLEIALSDLHGVVKDMRRG